MDEAHIVCRGVPRIVEHIAKLDLVMHTQLQPNAIARILGQLAAALEFAGLGVNIRFRLGHQVKGHGQTNGLGGIEGGQEVDPFDAALLGVVPMPADQIIFVGVGFLFDAVIEDENASGAFDLANRGFDNAPQVGTGFGRRSQEASHLIVRDFTVDQPRKPGGGGWAKGANQIIGVEVEHRLVHRSSLLLLPLTA